MHQPYVPINLHSWPSEENIHLRVVAPYAHWQLGKTERHGDILQDMLQKMDHESSLDSAEQFKLALHQCCSAKNALARSKDIHPKFWY